MKRRSDQRAASSCSSDSEQPLWKRRKSAPVESLPTTHQQTATRRLLPCPPLTPTTSDQIAEVLQLPKSSQNTHSNQEFNIFSALLKHPDLILYFARFLHLPTLVNLYSISKPFHWIVSARFMAVVHGQIAINAPLASRCWHWRLYIDLCMRDPGRRIRESKAGYAKNETVQLEDIEMPFSRRHRALGSNRLGSNQRSPEKTVSPRKKATITITDIRGIPSLRYLAMVAFRQGVVEDIVALFAREGIPLPDRIEETLAKMWSLIDVPYSTRRVGLMCNTVRWSNSDLTRAITFFLRLDLRLTHPIYGSGSSSVRTMLLGQRSLSYLCRVLKREELRTPLEALRMVLLFKYRLPRQYSPDVKSILGIPLKRLGLLQYEYWGSKPVRKPLIGIEALVLREGIRRNLNLANNAFSFMAGGYIDSQTGEDIWPQGAPTMSSGVQDHDSSDDGENASHQADRDASNRDEDSMKRDNDDNDEGLDEQWHPVNDSVGSFSVAEQGEWWDDTSDDQTDIENIMDM